MAYPSRLSTLLSISALSTALMTGCGGGSSTQTTTTTPTTPAAQPFKTVVVLGDSISAGFQNGSLLDSQQKNGWASLVATQAAFTLTLPLIASPGLPPVMELIKASLPPVIEQAVGTSTGRENTTVQATNMAVPGYKVINLTQTTPSANVQSTSQIGADLVLGYPLGATGSAVEQAVALKPTTVYLWIGGNDALGADDAGDPSTMTSVSDFSTQFAQVLTALKAVSGVHLIVGNVPDATEIPYMTAVSQIAPIVAQLDGISTSALTAALGVSNSDLLNPQGVADLRTQAAQLEAGQAVTPLSGSDVLTAAEVTQVQATINSYNQVIAQQVAAASGTVVDLNAYIHTLATSGITINNYAASTLFLGGIFSLDGIHPSNTGYALIANQFITATNTALGLSIPAVDVSAIAAQDPLFGPNRVGLTLPYEKGMTAMPLPKENKSLIFTGSVKK